MSPTERTEDLVVAGRLWMDASSAVAGRFSSGSSPTLAVSPRGWQPCSYAFHKAWSLKSSTLVLKIWKVPDEPLVLSQGRKLANAGSDSSEGISGRGSNQVNRLICKREGHVSKGRITLLLSGPLYKQVPRTLGEALPTLIKATRTILRLRLLSQMILVCGKLTLKPLTTRTNVGSLPSAILNFSVHHRVFPPLKSTYFQSMCSFNSFLLQLPTKVSNGSYWILSCLG